MYFFTIVAFPLGNHLADDFQTLCDIDHIMLIRAASARSIESSHILMHVFDWQRY